MPISDYAFLLKGSAVDTRIIKIRLLTDMAVHGVDPNNRSEFRISSLRGVMRFWWRTVEFELSGRNLLKEETERFGGIKPSENASASPVSFHIKSEEVKQEKGINLLPHHAQNNQRKAAKAVLKSGGVIELKMMTRKGKMPLYSNLFHYTMLLGSIGQRSRRGFGAFQFADSHYETVNDFRKDMLRTLDALDVKDISPGSKGCLLKHRQENPLAHPCLSAVYIGRPSDSPDALVLRYGHASHNASHNNKGALGSIKSYNQSKLSSPLWCSAKLIANKYYPVITELKSLPAMEKSQYARARDIFLGEMGVEQ